MSKNRIEAFSDGVIAIIITIMVLELKVPHGPNLSDLAPLLPVFLSYVLSFIYIGIYWNNHHHLFHPVKKISGAVMWANLHLLFWLSLVPFVTGWLGENYTGFWPPFFYGFNLFMSAVAYTILQKTILKVGRDNGLLEKAVGRDGKGKLSLAFYICGMITAFHNHWISYAFYLVVALMWIIRDKRIEQKVEEELRHHPKSE